MKIKQLLLMAATAAILTTTGAAADPYDHHDRGPGMAERHDRDGARGHDDWSGRDARHWRDDRGSWHADHDRYWRQGYRGYVGRDVYIRSLRANHFYRWDGEPYWFQGRYVIRTYDRYGRPIFVEMNPYTGGFVGVVRF